MMNMKEYIIKGNEKRFFASPNALPNQFELMNNLFSFINSLKNNNQDLNTLSIIDIRKMYLNKNL